FGLLRGDESGDDSLVVLMVHHMESRDSTVGLVGMTEGTNESLDPDEESLEGPQ
ncbi:hypothetical protein HAX54_022648, partial [Datura stramonium]|nr:hypothetical protein [Datura stramonium]